jgi:hypothetical protein
MSPFRFSRIWLLSAVAVLALFETACGGGDIVVAVGSGGTGIISGAVTKGPVSNATVIAYAVADGQPGVPLGSATTGPDGNFSLPIGSHAGPVLLQASAGTFRDEATGSFMTMPAGDVMAAAIPSVTAGATFSGLQITPVTSMAQARAQQMAGGMTPANIAAANAALGDYFLAGDILHVAPMNPLVAGSAASAGPQARNYGMTLAAMSQYAMSLNLANTSALVTSMASDASDGMMDGRRGSGAIVMGMGGGGMGGTGSSMMPANAGSTELAAAMTNFALSPANKSGLTAPDIAPLVQKISGSGGRF